MSLPLPVYVSRWPSPVSVRLDEECTSCLSSTSTLLSRDRARPDDDDDDGGEGEAAAEVVARAGSQLAGAGRVGH